MENLSPKIHIDYLKCAIKNLRKDDYEDLYILTIIESLKSACRIMEQMIESNSFNNENKQEIENVLNEVRNGIEWNNNPTFMKLLELCYEVYGLIIFLESEDKNE